MILTLKTNVVHELFISTIASDYIHEMVYKNELFMSTPHLLECTCNVIVSRFP